jgi:orotate phosphoribosyltransferase
MMFDTDGPGFAHKHHEQNPQEPRSPIKVHLCTEASRPEGQLTKDDMERMAYFLYERARQLQLPLRAVGAIPNVGLEIATYFQAYAATQGQHIPIVYASKILHPNGKREIGPPQPNKEYPPGPDCELLLLDDLINRRHTKNEATEQFRKAGYLVRKCLVFMDYGQGGSELLQKETAVETAAVVMLRNVLTLGHSHKRITPYQHHFTLQYMERMKAAPATS